MEDFNFLENEYFTEKTNGPFVGESGTIIHYHYVIKEEERQYRSVISLNESSAEYRYQYLLKIGTGNMWMPVEFCTTPYWFQELIKHIEMLKNTRQSEMPLVQRTFKSAFLQLVKKIKGIMQ